MASAKDSKKGDPEERGRSYGCLRRWYDGALNALAAKCRWMRWKGG